MNSQLTGKKISLEGGGDQDPGDPGVGNVRGKRIFFLQAGGELTLDDTMHIAKLLSGENEKLRLLSENFDDENLLTYPSRKIL